MYQVLVVKSGDLGQTDRGVGSVPLQLLTLFKAGDMAVRYFMGYAGHGAHVGALRKGHAGELHGGRGGYLMVHA